MHALIKFLLHFFITKKTGMDFQLFFKTICWKTALFRYLEKPEFFLGKPFRIMILWEK